MKTSTMGYTSGTPTTMEIYVVGCATTPTIGYSTIGSIIIAIGSASIVASKVSQLTGVATYANPMENPTHSQIGEGITPCYHGATTITTF